MIVLKILNIIVKNFCMGRIYVVSRIALLRKEVREDWGDQIGRGRVVDIAVQHCSFFKHVLEMSVALVSRIRCRLQN